MTPYILIAILAFSEPSTGRYHSGPITPRFDDQLACEQARLAILGSGLQLKGWSICIRASSK